MHWLDRFAISPPAVYYITVRYNPRRTCYRLTLVLAREDALRLRRLVSSTHAKRQDAASSKNGPEPSQRSIDSLGAVCPPHLVSVTRTQSFLAYQFC